MGLYELANERKADAQAIALMTVRSRLGLVEKIENMFDVRRCQSDAVVDDLQPCVTVVHAKNHLDTGILLGELQSVVQQVPDDLLQPWDRPRPALKRRLTARQG